MWEVVLYYVVKMGRGLEIIEMLSGSGEVLVS